MARRGYGQSDDVGWGYDVATQAEDILGFMDALRIERAVLVGRHPTTQDMTWIAEHHPERLAGLVSLHHALWPAPGSQTPPSSLKAIAITSSRGARARDGQPGEAAGSGTRAQIRECGHRREGRQIVRSGRHLSRVRHPALRQGRRTIHTRSLMVADLGDGVEIERTDGSA
jgi:pimeloyl-ACP methyl ester carboxylesterase